MNYCSRRCQSKDWFVHVFVCCVKNRPNDVDYLTILTRQWLAVKQELTSRAHFLTALFRDDHLCKSFGFNNCVKEIEVANLFCIYNSLTRGFSSKMLQNHLEHHTLGIFTEHWIQYQMAQTNAEECGCFQWFLIRYQLHSFNIPNHDGQYLHQNWAIHELEKKFSFDDNSVLSIPERIVGFLYEILLRDFNNIRPRVDQIRLLLLHKQDSEESPCKCLQQACHPYIAQPNSNSMGVRYIT